MRRRRRPDLRSPEVANAEFWYADSPEVPVRLGHPNQGDYDRQLGSWNFDSRGIGTPSTGLLSLILHPSHNRTNRTDGFSSLSLQSSGDEPTFLVSSLGSTA